MFALALVFFPPHASDTLHTDTFMYTPIRANETMGQLACRSYLFLSPPLFFIRGVYLGPIEAAPDMVFGIPDWRRMTSGDMENEQENTIVFISSSSPFLVCFESMGERERDGWAMFIHRHATVSPCVCATAAWLCFCSHAMV